MVCRVDEVQAFGVFEAHLAEQWRRVQVGGGFELFEHPLALVDRSLFVDFLVWYRIRDGASLTLHAALLEPLPQRRLADEVPQQPGELETEAMQEAVVVVVQVMADLPQRPLAESLITGLLEPLDLVDGVLVGFEMDCSLLHGMIWSSVARHFTNNEFHR